MYLDPARNTIENMFELREKVQDFLSFLQLNGWIWLDSGYHQKEFKLHRKLIWGVFFDEKKISFSNVSAKLCVGRYLISHI